MSDSQTPYTEADLVRVMANVFGVAPSAISEQSSIDTVASWDSLKHLNLVIALEEHFHVTFTEEEVIEILNYPLIKMTLEKHDIMFAMQSPAAAQD